METGYTTYRVTRKMMCKGASDFYDAVTGCACPCCDTGIITVASAKHRPADRVCRRCGRLFVAEWDAGPTLRLVGRTKRDIVHPEVS